MAKKVALMVGHGKSTNGTWDSGCAYAGNTEAALMLPVTKAAVKYLRNSGVSVISDADTNNDKNMIVDVAWANKEKADIYVSVHCDWYKAPTGVYPLYVSTKGKALANTLNSAIKSGIPMKSRGICRRTDLYELNATNMPACILETGSIKADIKTLKASDKYGKMIAKGICTYLGVKFKEIAEPAKTTAPAAKAPEPELYRVRKTWADAKSQIGAYKVLANAKKAADKNGLTVFDSKGKAVYTGKKPAPTPAPAQTIVDKEIEACKVQAEWMKNFKYGKWKPVTIAHSKTDGTCVTYVGCVLQRIGVFKSGEYIWHNGSGFGTGKVYGTNNKMTTIYMGNKTFTACKSSLKAGDIVLCDDNKSGSKGGGGHIMIFSGEWASNGNPYVYDQNSATFAKQGKSLLRSYAKSHKILAIVRLK